MKFVVYFIVIFMAAIVFVAGVMFFSAVGPNITLVKAEIIRYEDIEVEDRKCVAPVYRYSYKGTEFIKKSNEITFVNENCGFKKDTIYLVIRKYEPTFFKELVTPLEYKIPRGELPYLLAFIFIIIAVLFIQAYKIYN